MQRRISKELFEFVVGESAVLGVLLGCILESLNDDDSDLITSEPAERNRPTYTQAALRNHLEPHQVWSAMLVVVRYSRRMLVAIRESVGAGHQSF